MNTNDFSPAFGVVDAEGTENASDGHIELKGLPNTRDVGGMAAADGRFIKHARLLRSGALGHAETADIKVLLDDFDVRTVIDLRTEEERRENPDPEDAMQGVRFVDAPILSTSTFGVTREGGTLKALKMLRTLRKNPASIMEEVYERMMLDEESQRGFKRFFNEVLATENGAVLWHCTVGKDRAGLAAALLLHALGVSREAIEQDYLVTNRYVESETQHIADALAAHGLADKLDNSIRVLNSADLRFLHAAFDAVDRTYGGLDNYLRTQLNVTDEQRALLRERYLTDDPQG